MHNDDAANAAGFIRAEPRASPASNRYLNLFLGLVSIGFFLLSLWLFATASWTDPGDLIEVRRARSERVRIWGELLQDLERPEINRALQLADEEDLRNNLSTYRFRQAGYGGVALLLGFAGYLLRRVSCVRFMTNEAAVFRALGLAL